jgi:hypothetical protein
MPSHVIPTNDNEEGSQVLIHTFFSVLITLAVITFKIPLYSVKPLNFSGLHPLLLLVQVIIQFSPKKFNQRFNLRVALL